MEREPSGFPFLEINNILTQLKCLQLVKKWFYHFFDKLRAEPLLRPLRRIDFMRFCLLEVTLQHTLEGLAVASHLIVSPTDKALRVLWEIRYNAVFQCFTLTAHHISSQISLKSITGNSM